ncbi:Fic family protein, partial [Corynebacterium diphtheriae]
MATHSGQQLLSGRLPGDERAPDMFTQSTLEMFNVDFSPKNRHYSPICLFFRHEQHHVRPQPSFQRASTSAPCPSRRNRSGAQNDELFRAAWNVDAEPTPATKEALRYNAALHTGLESIGQRPLSAKTTQIVCGTLQSDEPHIAPFRSYPGTFIGNPHTQQRIYTPPEGREVIEQHLSRWERYIYSEHDVDSLVKMALLHYQFEAIHPFTDGNGRTGRILNVLYLLQEALLPFPVLYLSGYIVENKAQYYRCLNRVTTESAWEDWLLFMIRGVEVAATDASTMIADLRQVQDEITAVIRDAGIISPAKEMSEITMVRPYLRIQDVEDSGLVKRQTAATWLNHLVDIGVLSETKRGR